MVDLGPFSSWNNYYKGAYFEDYCGELYYKVLRECKGVVTARKEEGAGIEKYFIRFYSRG